MPSHPSVQVVHYQVSTSEVDVGRRLLLVTDPSGRVLWRTTRELVHDEIVESIMDSTGQVLWTIHKPIRGWYLIIRSPSYNNPRTHIALQPLKLRGPENEDRFIFRLKPLHIPLSPAPPSTEGLSGASLPTTVDPIPSPHNRLESASMGSPGSSEPSNPISNNTSDVDAPHVVISSSNLESEASLTSRPMLGSDSQAVQSRMSLRLSSDADDPGVQPSHSYSVTPTEIDFLLRPLTPTVPISAISRLLTFFGDTSKSFCCSRPGSASLIENIMSFEDQTSMFQLATKGDLRIQAEVLTKYGMPMCFWVAIALAYLGFRADKEAYQAATEDIQ